MPEHAFNPGDQLGHYRLIEKIGKGGQGEVWRAKDERFGRDVALKILPPKALADSAARDRFRREALAVGKLNHPNIATAHDFNTQPVDYLVTEYVSGVGLDQRLASGALPEGTVVALGLQLAGGLEAAHREGIVHRDLKPGNMRIKDDGKLKILDFGLAEMFDPSKDFASLETITINLTLTGTLPYMAPEQFNGVADQRTDLWSVGAVLYEMATGKLPFPETQVQDLREAIQHKEPLHPRHVNPAISPGLEQVILRCLKKNPAQRYQTATELHQDLERLAQGRKTREQEKRQGRKFALAALAAVLAVSMLAVWYNWPQIRRKLWPTAEETANQFHSMAILPLDTASQNPSDDALVRGVADTVSAQIAQGTNRQRLQVIPPGELIAQNVKTTDAARREFGVERVLEVSVQRSGDKLRVTCSLIDSKTHKLLNACSVTGDGTDLFNLQDELAGRVIAMLPQDLRNQQAAPSEVLAATPAGYEFYLKGRGYLLDYHKPENVDAAIKQFEQALKVNPNYAPALAGLGEAYWRQYKLDLGAEFIQKAKSACERSLAIDRTLSDGHVCLGNVFADTGRYDEAVNQFQQALEKQPENVNALGGLAMTYEKLNDSSRAEETYKKAISLHPQYWAVYHWLGNFYYAQARYSDASAMYRKVIDLRPDNQRAYYDLGAMQELEGKYDDAIASLNRSIEILPTMDAYSNLGAAYFWQHRYAEAVPAFEKARALDDKDYLNWGNLADALYWSPNRREEAIAAYRHAIQLAQEQIKVNPKNSSARAYVAEYSAMVGDAATAQEQIRHALELAPSDPDLMFRAALVSNQLGDSTKTIEWLQKAVAGGYSRTVIRDTPDFAQLQANAGFKALLTAK